MTRPSGVAEQYATNRADRYQDGTVLVETLAPPEAILSAPALLLPDDENAGEEYVVDRRRLGKVRVVSRFANPTVE
jgi:hypothetical protein